MSKRQSKPGLNNIPSLRATSLDSDGMTIDPPDIRGMSLLSWGSYAGCLLVYEQSWPIAEGLGFDEGFALLTNPPPLSPACLFAADAEGGGEPVGEGGGEPVGEEGGDLVEEGDDDLLHGA